LIDIVGRGFDAGFRLAEVVPPNMIRVFVSPSTRIVVVGLPAYFAGRSYPAVPLDLHQNHCIRARMASGRIYHWEFERRGESLAIAVPGPLILDESGPMSQAALAGAGLAYLAEAAIAELLANGRLVQVREEWTPTYEGLYLYFPGRRHVPAKLRALIELIREQAK
jgi:DNA-binding transcriptional LysR family regulator